MIEKDEATVLVEQLASLRYFPSDEATRQGISRLLQRICAGYQEGQWLVDRMNDLFSEWPGPTELRAVYCAKFKPEDGIERKSDLYPYSWVITGENPKQIAGPELPALPPPEIFREISSVADIMRMPRPLPAPTRVEKPPVVSVLPQKRLPIRPCGCDGSGMRGPDRYCQCEMGLELYRVAHRGERETARRQAEVSEDLKSMGL